MKLAWLRGSLGFLAFTAAGLPAAAQTPTEAAPEPGLAAEPAPAPVVVEQEHAVAPAPPTEVEASPELKWYEPLSTPVKVESAMTSARLGFLLQPQFESVGSPALDGQSNNLFLRRTRFLFGMTAFKDLDLFFDTEFANLLKAGADGVKSTPGMNILDAFLTYKVVGDLFKVDAGYLLPPLSHNALQSAGTMLSWDYFVNSFRHSNVFGTSADPTGRDLGLQLRGLVADGLLEYRVAMLQGLREPQGPDMPPTEVQSQNMFRLAARLQLNLLDPETGYFYGGTYLGTKKVLSFGVAYDFQDSYKYLAIDGLLDLPIGPGVLTAQVNVVQMDGDDWLALPKQTAIMGEAGFTFASLRLAPIVRFEQRIMDTSTAAAPDETRISGGLAYWAHSHSFNVKAFFTHVDPDLAVHSYNQINLQTQLYLF